MNSVFENQYVGVLGYSWGGLAALRLGSDAKEATVDAVVAVHPHVDPDTKQAYPDPMLVPTQVIVGPKGSSAFGQALGHDGGPLPFANPYAYRGYCEHFCLDKHATYDFGLNTKDGDIHAKMRVKRARDNVVYFFRMFLNLGGVLTLPEDVRDSRKDMMELKYDLHDPCGQGSLMKLAEELKAQFPHKKEDIDRYVADVARDEMMELLQL